MNIPVNIILFVVLISVLASPVTALAEPPTVSDGDNGSPASSRLTIPDPEELRGRVEFWMRIFSEFGVGQVVVHDMDNPGLIYEVVDLPGEQGDSYTKEQEKFVEKLRKTWEEKLEESRIRVRTQRGHRERFRKGIEIGRRYEPAIMEILDQAGLPRDLAYLPHIESSYQVAARSSAGAVGVWQFTRSTGRKYLRINYAVDERLDPLISARAAARYLRTAYEQLGDWALAVTSYNYGINGMRRASERFGKDIVRIIGEHDGRSFGFASRNFYAEFLAAREIATKPEHFFPEGLIYESPIEFEEVVLGSRMAPARVARRYGVPLQRLAELNPSWSRRALYGGLAIPAGTSVWLPEGTLDRNAAGRTPVVDLTLPDLDSSDFHTVTRGETLSSIALRYGISVHSLRRLNGMERRESTIYTGEKLIVRRSAEGHVDADGTVIHVVSRGENLSLIAAGYGVRLGDLLAANSLNRKSIIYPGQRLKIPSS